MVRFPAMGAQPGEHVPHHVLGGAAVADREQRQPDRVRVILLADTCIIHITSGTTAGSVARRPAIPEPSFACNTNRRAAQARTSRATAKPKSPTPNWTIGAFSAATSPPLTNARIRHRFARCHEATAAG